MNALIMAKTANYTFLKIVICLFFFSFIQLLVFFLIIFFYINVVLFCSCLALWTWAEKHS